MSVSAKNRTFHGIRFTPRRYAKKPLPKEWPLSGILAQLPTLFASTMVKTCLYVDSNEKRPHQKRHGPMKYKHRG